jgi:hypothetical protein
MSSEKADEKSAHRKPEGSYGRIIRVGLVGPKPYPGEREKAMDNRLVILYRLSADQDDKGGTQEGQPGAPNGHGALLQTRLPWQGNPLRHRG